MLRFVPLPRAGAAFVGEPGDVRVGPCRVAVERHVLHVVAAVEDLLRAVAVVVVDVEHRHLRLPVVDGDVMGGDRRVVEEAVPAVHGGRRVMARRAAQAVRVAGAVEHRPGRGQRDVDGAPRRRRRCPSVSGVVVSKHHLPSSTETGSSSRSGPIPSSRPAAQNTSGTTSWVPG